MAEPAPENFRVGRHWPLTTSIAAISVIGIVVFIVTMAATRSLFNVDAEIDTIHTFIPEARQLAKLDQLQVKYHLPGYSLAIGVAFAVVGDWLRAGLVVSAAAAAFALVASYFAFHRLWGFAGGLGAIAGLATSPVFLSYSAMATSDVPFLALYVASLLFAVRAFQTNRKADWAVTGAFVAAAMLTRTNGIALFLLLFMPLLASHSGKRRKHLVASAWAGFGLLVGLWILYCTVTGSPLLPQEARVNLAVTYYTEGSRGTGDDMRAVEGLFASTTELLLADPARILRIYWQDLSGLPRAIATQLLWPPILLLALGGAWIWWRDRRNPVICMLAVVAVASLLLLNLHAFLARYYLYLLPFFGATAGALVGWALARLKVRTFLVRAATGIVALALLAGVVRSGIEAQAHVESLENIAEFGESIATVKRRIETDARIITRKPTLPMYAGRRRINFPPVETVTELCESVRSQPADKPMYLYIGREERRARQSLIRELEAVGFPAWLEPVDARQGPAAWQLFRIRAPVDCQ